MNRIHRLVFNRALGVCQAVSEVATAGRGGATGAAGAVSIGAPALSRIASACLMALAALGGSAAIAAGGGGGDAYTDGTNTGGRGGRGGVPVTTGGAVGNGGVAGNGGFGGAGGAGGSVGDRVDASGAVTGLVNGGAGGAGQNGNANTAPRGGAGGGGGGGAGIYTVRTQDTVIEGSVTGGAGGNGANVASVCCKGTGYGGGGGGGQGGAGVAAASGGALAIGSGASIAGGRGGDGGAAVSKSNGGAGGGGDGGAGVELGSGMSIVNNGSIAGGSGGFGAISGNGAMSVAGAGGVGITGADISILNNGTVSGGYGGSKTQASAIEFTGGVNTLEIHGASKIDGAVIANGKNDTLIFGGTQDGEFDLGAFVDGSISGFERYKKTGSSTWTMVGSVGGAPTGQILEGTLRLGDGIQTGLIAGAAGADGTTVIDSSGHETGASGGNGQTALDVGGGQLRVEGGSQIYGGNGGSGSFSAASIVNDPTTATGGAGGNGGDGVAHTGGLLRNAGSIQGGEGGQGGSAGLTNIGETLLPPSFAPTPFGLTGGTGGNGGNGVASDSAALLVNDGHIEGGRGGYGGYASNHGHDVEAVVQGGSGGNGGHGVLFTASGAQFQNNGSVRGGDGGQGGSNDVDALQSAQSSAIANGGAAGAGVMFAGAATLTNTTTGTIEGGHGGNTGSTRATVYGQGFEPASIGDAIATATGATTARSGGAGVYFGGAASITNAGSITGGTGAGSGGVARMARDSGGGSTAEISFNDSQSAYSGTLTAKATGSVGGQGGEAVVMTQGGQLTNSPTGLLQGGSGGDGASASALVYITEYNPTFARGPLLVPAVTATTSATGGDGGRGGDAVVTTGGSIVNEGTIQGGNGGRGGSASAYFERYGFSASNDYQPGEQIGGKGGTGGIAVVASATTLLNAEGASIRGGDGGASGNGGQLGRMSIMGVGAPSIDANAGAGNLAISGSDLAIVNAGTIAGGFSGDGLTQAAAIAFTGGVNSLTLHAASKIAGNVSAFSTADTLALGGQAEGTFDVAAIGPEAQYRGFGVFRKVDPGTWNLQGVTTAVTPWTIDQGTLAIATDASLGDVSSALTIGAGTLRTTADITSARKLVLASPASTIANAGNTVLALNGTVSGTGTLVKEETGTLRLGAANSYSGGTDIRAGYVATQVNGALGTGPVAVRAGGSLLLDGSFNAGNLAISTADGEGILNSGFVQFKDKSSAGNATLQNQGSLEFRDNATAGTSSIRNDGGSTVFWESTTAGNATITAANKGSTNFWDNSSAGTAKLVNEAGGSTEFWDNSTGDNATVVNGAGGTLRIRDLTSSGTSIGSIEGEGRIQLGEKALTTGGLGTSTTISGVISGAGGSLTKVGEGTLTLAAANTYTGGTNVAAGTLQLGNGGTSGSIVGDVVNNGTLAFNRSDAVSFAGAISGSGAVQQRGAGTTTLTADNTYTGGTTIAAGTLQVGNGGTTGSIAGNVVNNANLAINRSDAVTVPGSISGSGAVQQIGAGTTTLTGTNTYTGGTTIAAGTLVGGTSSFGSGAIANNGALVIDQPTDATFGNTLSGDGSLTKTGDATVFYTGDGTAFTGALQVKSGTLSVKSALNATVTVEPGSVLKGNGSVGNTFVSNGATVAPGNSIGTLTVNGNLSFAPGAFYEVETNPQGQSDRIDVTGTATLGGASVVAISADGNWGTTTRYTILTSGNRVGTFGGVSSNFAFLDPSLTYEGNNVLLTLNRNAVAFPTVGQTFNQRASGAALDALGGGALYNAVVQLDAPTARSAFDQLSGELHASVRSSLMEDSRFVREAGIDRLRQAQGAATDLKTVEGMDGAAWARVYGSWGKMDSDGNAAKVDRDTSGVLVGADRRVGAWRVGVMGGAGRSTVDVDARHSSAKIDNYHLGVYGGTEWGALALRTGASYSRHDIDTNRIVGFTGVAGSTEGSYHARTAQVFGELGWRIDADRFALEPFANLAYANLKTDGFTERGGISALSSRGESTGTTFTTLGLRASTRLGAEADSATLRGLLGWRHAFGDVSQSAALAFAGGNSFRVGGVPIAKDAAVIEAGVDFAIQRDLTLGVSYTGQVGDGVKDHGVKASLLWKF